MRITATVDRGDIARLIRRFDKLQDKELNNALRRGLRHGGKELIKEAKRRVPKRFGFLRRSIGGRVKSYRRGLKIIYVIGPRRGFKRPRPGTGKLDNPTRYAHLVEYGTVHSRQNAFMRPAWDLKHRAVMMAIARVLRATLARFGA